ncbi:hypothetical protein F2Q69_00012446 [Brassica cretica]|uniref:Uncharacterized protein n=1 Tax=Brassica cretica TaxID=69181 RepID=A0A8S9QXK9_BRACR|nr:hypothetical protein F2Q69_00012446 [Brassica cretica]
MSFGGSHWCRSTPSHEHRSTEVIQNRSTFSPGHRLTTPMESTTSCNAVSIMTHEEFTAKHPHPPSPVYVKYDRHSDPVIDRHQETAIDRQPPAPIDRRAPLTYRLQMPKIDVARLNALSPKPKPSKKPPKAVRTPSEDETDSMEEKENFRKRVFRIPLDKPFEKAYFTFFRETRETEEDIRRMFCEAREKMRKRVTLKKKSDPGQFAIPCTVKGIEFPHALYTSPSFLLEKEVAIDRQKRFNIDRHSTSSTKPPSALTDIAYHPSIDTNVDATRDGEYSIGSWADDRHHDSYAVETSYRDQRADELHEGFTYAELLNMQRRDETDQKRAEAAWERTHISHLIVRTSRPSIFINPSASIDMDHTTSINICPIPKSIGPRWLRKSNRWTYTAHISREYYRHPSDSQWSRQPLHATTNIPEHQEKVTKEFYDTASGIDSRFKQKSRHPTRPSIDVDVPTSVDRRPEFGRRAFDLFCTRKFYWEEKNEYGIYRDDQGFARDVDGHTICVQNKDIRRLLERASRDDPNYICLPEHASSFTQTKLVPEIYTKDKINEMFYGDCGEQENNKEDFQMKLDRVYYPLNDSISWQTTCMEEMRQYIARIQHATDVSRPTMIDRRRQASIDSHLPASIDNRLQASVDDNPPHSHMMKFQPDFHTKEEIDQLVEGIYRALKTTEEKLDRRCDDIYFPMDLTTSVLTSKIEAIQGELVEIQSYITRRSEASTSIDRRNNKSTDIHRQTSVDEVSYRGRLVQKVTSDMSDTHNSGEEISADTYATVMRHQFNLESLGDRLQKIEDETTIMKDKWRRGDEAMRDFTDPDPPPLTGKLARTIPKT